MTLDEATEIVDAWVAGKKFDAIRALRSSTSLDLVAAKEYFEQNSGSGRESFLTIVCDDFVQSPVDLLFRTEQEIKRLENYAKSLREQIMYEDMEAISNGSKEPQP